MHEPDATELQIDEATQLIFDHGRLVGGLARQRFPGSVSIDYEPWQYQERCEATRAALKAGTSSIYEASFRENGVFVAVDVLERNGSGFNLIEVEIDHQTEARAYSGCRCPTACGANRGHRCAPSGRDAPQPGLSIS